VANLAYKFKGSGGAAAGHSPAIRITKTARSRPRSSPHSSFHAPVLARVGREPAPKDFSVSRGTSMNVKNQTDSNATLISVLISDANVSPLTYCDGEEGHH
jgi:hypothetical protein